MRIVALRAKNYRSLHDVKIESLADVNVFHGLNNAGKSNVLAAMHFLFNHSRDYHYKYPQPELSPTGSSNLVTYQNARDWFFRNTREFEIEATLEDLDTGNVHLPFVPVGTGPWTYGVRVKTATSNGDSALLVDEVWLRRDGADAIGLLSIAKVEERRQQARQAFWNVLEGQFYRLGPFRRMEPEKEEKEEGALWPYLIKEAGEGHGLKRLLFEAQSSADPHLHGAFLRLTDTIARPPFTFSRLTVAREPGTRILDILVTNKHGRLPLASMGTGIQQLVLQLFVVFVVAPHASIVAVEEPETHLNAALQRQYFSMLRGLTGQGEPIRQLFLTSHAPVFEDLDENFYEVALDDERGTVITRRAYADAARLTTPATSGPGAPTPLYQVGRLLDDLVIRLPPGVAEDMGLKRGDRIYFDKRPGAQWELLDETTFDRRISELGDGAKAKTTKSQRSLRRGKKKRT